MRKVFCDTCGREIGGIHTDWADQLWAVIITDAQDNDTTYEFCGVCKTSVVTTIKNLKRGIQEAAS